MRIATHNVNGIRATLNRGWADWLASRGLDVLGLQEVRCRVADLPTGAFGSYVATLDAGTLPGRNGVALLTKTAPEKVRTLSGSAHQIIGDQITEIATETITSRALAQFSHEGRYIEVDLADAPVRVASLYLPKGASWPHEGEKAKPKYDRKMAFLAGFATLLTASRREAAAQGREFLVMGDFNIAHTKNDLRNWKSNQKSEGFLPEERDWFTSILSERTLHDVVRRVHPDQDGPYSWWSWRGQAFTNDTGWRIDYHLASPGLAARATNAGVDREEAYDLRLSDHSPVVIDYDFPATT